MLMNIIFPFFPVLASYKASQFRADLMAAITITPMAVPSAMAYAVIAGVSPEYGIYTCMLPVIVAALWGSSRFLVSGPTNGTSLILFSSLASVQVSGVAISTMPPEQRMAIIFGIAIFCGCLQVMMGLARLGELVNFISVSVMTGFSAAMAFLIASSQLPVVLGTEQATGNFFSQVWQVSSHVLAGQFSLFSLGLALLTIVLALVLRKVSRIFPAMLAAMATTSMVAWLFGAREHGIAMIGTIGHIVPPLSLPPKPDLAMMGELFAPAMALAILGAVQSLAIGKQLAGIRGDHFDGNRELIGQGLGNLAAGFASGIPGCGSFTRSAPMVSLGAKTRMAAVFSGLLALPMLFLLASLLEYVPMAALGGILMMIAVQTLRPADIKLCLMATRVDATVFVCTFLSTLVLNLTQAILIGVMVSFALFIYKTSHPRVKQICEGDSRLPYPLPGGVMAWGIEGVLFFGAIHELENRLAKLDDVQPEIIILHLARVFWLDASGACALEQFLERSHARSIPVIVVLDNQRILATLTRTGVMDLVGEGFHASSLKEGIILAGNFLARQKKAQAKY